MYVTDLDEIGNFIGAYLVEMGADLKQGIRKLVRKWL